MLDDVLFILIVILIATIVTCVIALLPFKRSDDIAAFAFLGIIIFVPAFNYTHVSYKVVDHNDTKIYSTANRSTNQINGHFILGTGTIHSEEVYFANVEVGKNRFERLYIPVEDVVRIIDSNLTNYAIYRIYYCESKHIFTPDRIQECRFLNGKKNELYIPKNSIIKQLSFQ